MYLHQKSSWFKQWRDEVRQLWHFLADRCDLTNRFNISKSLRGTAASSSSTSFCFTTFNHKYRHYISAVRNQWGLTLWFCTHSRLLHSHTSTRTHSSTHRRRQQTFVMVIINSVFRSNIKKSVSLLFWQCSEVWLHSECHYEKVFNRCSRSDDLSRRPRTSFIFTASSHHVMCQPSNP